MAVFKNYYNVDLGGKNFPRALDSMVCQDNVAGNQVGAYVFEDGVAASLGGTCSGRVIRADGTVIALDGTVDGNLLYVTLTSQCYEIPGMIEVVVNSVRYSATTTIVKAFGTVERTTTGAVVPSANIPNLDQLLAQISAMQEATSDAEAIITMVADLYSASAAYAVGDYCIHDGVFYMCTTAIAAPGEVWNSAHWTATNVGAEIYSRGSALNGSIGNLDNGKLKISDTFVFGTLDTNGALIEFANNSRCTGVEYYTAKSGDVLTLDTGFSMILCEYNASKTLVDRGIKAAGNYILTAGNLYRVTILSVDQTIQSNPYEYAFKAHLQSEIDKKIDSVNSILSGLSNDITNVLAQMAPIFDQSTAFAVGDYCIYQDELYIFTTAHAAGAWDSSQVINVKLGNQVTVLSSAIYEHEGDIVDLRNALNSEKSERIQEDNFIKNNAVRVDITQNFTSEQRRRARMNIGMSGVEFALISGDEYMMVLSSVFDVLPIGNHEFSLVFMEY